ncbi:glutamate-cysteine ligase family protein [Thalassotalea sp. G2M2-11]|uniref:glutamate-cysteine ligase family protein n=1 Tax=Thalassotalea sp. G2M2-11 TaxID=2787627 RepID=UPI0019D02DF5|nr:glutamate-cysteine ligase family protein [Thalassotalea sp. G2M2-11]
MGQNIDQTKFSEKDYAQFQTNLFQQLEQLKSIIAAPTFGQEPLKLGAELEMYLIDDEGKVKLTNQLLLSALDDPQYQPELNQYNLELNLTAILQQGTPFTQLLDEIRQKTAILEQVALDQQTNIVPIGILPTLVQEDLTAQCMTNIARYSCLADHIYQQRGQDFNININGDEALSVNFSDISAEGANTSFQVHLMTAPDQLVNIYNAAQLTLPFVTAIGANSPIFLGKSLWDETRIALFKQALDIRLRGQFQWQQPTRVNFGQGWVRNSIWELFAEAVALYPPLLPIVKQAEHENELPELCFHLGTIWPWHRPVYNSAGNGHIRLEFRAIPAGPTSIDMVANAAFAIGLATGMAKNIDELITFMPFKFAEYNFYRSAQHGLDAKILWPAKNKYQPQEIDIKQVISKLLPVAHQGLISLNICSNEASYYLNIIEQRLTKQLTGAVWQKQTLKALEKNMNKEQACQALVLRYLKNCRTCQPVATWDQL